jgi:hypothetical protein
MSLDRARWSGRSWRLETVPESGRELPVVSHEGVGARHQNGDEPWVLSLVAD